MIKDSDIKDWMYEPPTMKQLEYVTVICDGLDMEHPKNLSKFGASVFIEMYQLKHKYAIWKHIERNDRQEKPMQQVLVKDPIDEQVANSPFSAFIPKECVGVKEEYVEPSRENSIFSFPLRAKGEWAKMEQEQDAMFIKTVCGED